MEYWKCPTHSDAQVSLIKSSINIVCERTDGAFKPQPEATFFAFQWPNPLRTWFRVNPGGPWQSNVGAFYLHKRKSSPHVQNKDCKKISGRCEMSWGLRPKHTHLLLECSLHSVARSSCWWSRHVLDQGCQTCSLQAKTSPPQGPIQPEKWMCKVWKWHRYINSDFQ